MENRGEYVQFAKETSLLKCPSEKLQKLLEEELKLNRNSLLSHGWYHGRIPWKVSETLVKHDGDFLIHDSLMSMGDYVLTSHWNRKTLHFQISKVLVKSNDTYTQVRYTLDGETFDSVPALVQFLLDNRKPVTQQSGAYICSPVNRSLPLWYVEASYALTSPKETPVKPLSKHTGSQKRRSVSLTEILPMDISPNREEVRRHSDDVEQPDGAFSPSSTKFNSRSQQKRHLGNRKFVIVSSSPGLQTSMHLDTAPNSSAVSYMNPTDIVFSGPHTNSEHYKSMISSGPQLPVLGRGENAWTGKDKQALSNREENKDYFIPPMEEATSSFRPCKYQSSLLPSENKPLETRLLKRVKEMLVEVDTKTIALHITKIDCMVAGITDATEKMSCRMGVSCGLELLTLPHGHHLRQDLIERSHTLSVMLAVELLGCTGNIEERAALIHKIIQLATELRDTVGNLFGFTAVMKTLELPQISRLDKTWMTLRQRHTDSAVQYEKCLKPFLRNLNYGKESWEPSDTTFPHVQPLLSLMERTVVSVEGAEPWENLDIGVESLLSHLNAARTIASHGLIFRSNAETKLHGFVEQPDVLEVFLTDFQMRLLWGSCGAEKNREERYDKFDKVLTALSNRLEPPPH
ncbi:SH2 domain containing 3Cb [Chanos chanos]|uniref:SH2 domain containing 3Cb n=1 Tax=Chanos chanos TaxID=29144 RepID=A0A6J2WT51_CHACN|nr:SH2 domain-containing protein 3C-like [Chanos chanos]